MTLHPDLVRARLEEITRVVAELAKYRGTGADALRCDLSLRWIIERGIMAGAGLVFDVADHLLAAVFSEYPDSYEASLVALRDHGVISSELYAAIRGLGHVRNLLAHDYVEVDVDLLARHLDEALGFFPAFCRELAAWLAARQA
jgi:uncharacterized protein YutE (UPF0331/DUF86 family)